MDPRNVAGQVPAELVAEVLEQLRGVTLAFPGDRSIQANAIREIVAELEQVGFLRAF